MWIAREADRLGSGQWDQAYTYSAKADSYTNSYSGEQFARDENGKWGLYFRNDQAQHEFERHVKVKEIKEALHYGGWMAFYLDRY